MNGAMVVLTIVWLNVVNHFGYGGNGVASNLVNPSIVYHNIIACACQHILIVSPCGSSILISLSHDNSVAMLWHNVVATTSLSKTYFKVAIKDIVQ